LRQRGVDDRVLLVQGQGQVELVDHQLVDLRQVRPMASGVFSGSTTPRVSPTKILAIRPPATE
jgi:hypothetical protein